MNNSFSITMQFKEIFPNYESFSEFLSVYTNIDVVANSVILYYLYDSLFQRYGLSNICYGSPTEFKTEVALIFKNYFPQFKFRYDKIQEELQITTEDLIQAQKAINYVSQDYNKQSANNFSELPYLSLQTGAQVTTNKFEALIKAIVNINDMFLENFLAKFLNEFIRLQPMGYPFYIKGGN